MRMWNCWEYFVDEGHRVDEQFSVCLRSQNVHQILTQFHTYTHPFTPTQPCIHTYTQSYTSIHTYTPTHSHLHSHANLLWKEERKEKRTLERVSRPGLWDGLERLYRRRWLALCLTTVMSRVKCKDGLMTGADKKLKIHHSQLKCHWDRETSM